MAGDERVNFFTGEAEARAMAALKIPLFVVPGGVDEGLLYMRVFLVGVARKEFLVSVPNKVHPRDLDAEYDAFIGKVACLL